MKSKFHLPAAFLATFSAVILTTTMARAEDAKPSTPLETYLAIANALFSDDLAAAKEAASGLAANPSNAKLAEAAGKVAQAKDLAGAREAFKGLSAVAVAEAKGSKTGLMVMQCPMVKGGGGIWLSPDADVNNPYFGAMMPHCGHVVKP